MPSGIENRPVTSPATASRGRGRPNPRTAAPTLDRTAGPLVMPITLARLRPAARYLRDHQCAATAHRPDTPRTTPVAAVSMRATDRDCDATSAKWRDAPTSGAARQRRCTRLRAHRGDQRAEGARLRDRRVSGSSMGALVGGLQAAGKLDEFADWARTLTQRAVLRLLDPAITPPACCGPRRFSTRFATSSARSTIEALPIPYTAVTTDLIAGQVGVASARARRCRDPGLHRDPRRDRTACARRTPARRRRDTGPAADGADRRGQRRPDHRGQPERQ